MKKPVKTRKTIFSMNIDNFIVAGQKNITIEVHFGEVAEAIVESCCDFWKK